MLLLKQIEYNSVIPKIYEILSHTYHWLLCRALQT